MSNSSDTGTAEEEKKTNDLLALLYPEDGEQVDEDTYADDDELASMRGLRSLFQELPDQEPSDAVSNKLLALAAQHAPAAKSESRGFFAWFSDLMMPLVAHPGLAAAATLVLLVGVAGTLYVKGGTKVAEPQASSQGALPGAAPAAEPTMEAEAPMEAALEEEEMGEGQALDELADQDTDPVREQDNGYQEQTGARKEKKRQSAESDGVIGGLLGGSAQGKLNAESNSDDFEFAEDAPGDAKGGKTGSAPTGSSSGSDSFKVKDIDTRDFSMSKTRAAAPKEEQAPEPSPPPPSPVVKKPAPVKSAPSTTAPDADKADDSALEQEEAKESNATEAARLHALARAAAKKNDCDRVNALAKQIRALDSAYYDRSFLSDASLKTCRAAAATKK